jgi:predicted transcriptional regulator
MAAARHAKETREVVTFRMEPALIRGIEALAAADRRSRSEMIEQAVRELIERRQGKRPKRS